MKNLKQVFSDNDDSTRKLSKVQQENKMIFANDKKLFSWEQIVKYLISHHTPSSQHMFDTFESSDK